MKKILWLLFILLIMVQGLWGQFYNKLPQDKRKELAEAYYLVGNQYGTAGVEDKAEEFREMAFNIDSGLIPENIKTIELPSAAALILKGEAKILARPKERIDTISQLIRSKFLRLVSSFISKDTDSFLNLIDGSLYLAQARREITQEDIRNELEYLFKTVSLSGLVPSQVYDFNSLEIKQVSPTISQAWGDTYSLKIKALTDFSKNILFWEDHQQFLIHQSENKWLIFSVGKDLPPSDWIPKKAPEPALKKISITSLQGPGKEIKTAFLSCLDYFLKKDVHSAIEYFSKNIRILRLNTTLSIDEMASTFKGYFEDSDFSGILPQDVLETESIFTEETQQFEDLKKAPVYLLTVKTRLDLSDKIPFWTRFQEYYFIQEDEAWKIFAIF